MGRLADYLFGANDPYQAREVLKWLFLQEKNRFSYHYCDVLEFQDQVVGLLLSYPSACLKELAVPMGKHLSQFLGWSGMFRLLRRSMPFMKTKETEPDEYYIYTLAILPEFQNHGLGADLLAHGEDKGRASGLPKCSLGVTLDNAGARRFYERHGYITVESFQIPRLHRKIGYPGYTRMVKHLHQPGVAGS